VLEIPEEANVTAGYPVAVLAGSREPAAARAFVDLLLGAEGARVLERHGLTPAHAP
jgi:molybdate transport system substrate-binding protein